MTGREDEAKPYDQRMLELLEEAERMIASAGVGQWRNESWRPWAVRWRERYAKLLADRAQP